MPVRRSRQPQPPPQQLLPQPQLCSQPQDASSQQQEASSQQPLLCPHPQPLPQNEPNKPSSRQPPPPQQASQQLASQPQLASSQQQLCSAQHDFSQQLQLGSQQQPQPEPSMRSSKPKPKLGLARATLSMSAPKKFHFIARRLLYVGTTRAEDLPTSGNARCRPTPNQVGHVGRTHSSLRRAGRFDCGVRGTLKVPGVEIRRACLGGSHGGRHHQSSQSLARISPG